VRDTYKDRFKDIQKILHTNQFGKSRSSKSAASVTATPRCTRAGFVANTGEQRERANQVRLVVSEESFTA